jgi:hypothetical protein
MKTLSRARARNTKTTNTSRGFIYLLLRPILFIVEILCDTRGRAKRISEWEQKRGEL